MRAKLKVIVTSGTVAAAAGLIVAGSALTAPADPTAGRPLDGVPGFGLSPDAVMRDEVISVWEAWSRDSQISTCMAGAGFQWQPEVLYPEEAVLTVAENLDVTPDLTAVPILPVDANMDVAASLSAKVRESYYQALYGESAEAIEFVQDNGGVLPPGESPDSFATGGCYGQAQATVGSVWNLKRDVGPELTDRQIRAREAILSQEDTATYGQCAANMGMPGMASPEALDKAMAGTGGLDRAAEASGQWCAPVWNTISEKALASAADQVRANHSKAFEVHEARYNGLVAQIKRDEAFKDYLAEATGRYLAPTRSGS